VALSALDKEDLVEMYGAASLLEGQRLVLLLEEDGIEALVRETTASSFPSAAEAHYLVCVRAGDIEKARAVVEAARRDGAISLDGDFF
jgi:hypothetical protein